MSHYLTTVISDRLPRPTIEMGGDRAKTIFGHRWPAIRPLVRMTVEERMNVNADYSDDFPDVERMTGAAKVESIEFGSDFKGEPVATYLVRCEGVNGESYMHVELVIALTSSDALFVRSTRVGED